MHAACIFFLTNPNDINKDDVCTESRSCSKGGICDMLIKVSKITEKKITTKGFLICRKFYGF